MAWGGLMFEYRSATARSNRNEVQYATRTRW